MAKRYESKGTPLNEREREILENLIEECGEVVQAATKLLRFGKEDTSPSTGASNTYTFGIEVGQLGAMVELAQQEKLLLQSDIEEGMVSKVENLKVFSKLLP